MTIDVIIVLAIFLCITAYCGIEILLEIIAKRALDKHPEIFAAKAEQKKVYNHVQELGQFWSKMGDKIHEIELKKYMYPKNDWRADTLNYNIEELKSCRQEVNNNLEIARSENRKKKQQVKDIVYQCVKSRILRKRILKILSNY
jgi:hypothetical protein